jgi:hypothetical protein
MRPRHRKHFFGLLRFTTLWLVSPLACLLAIRLIWGVESSQRLAAVQQELRAAGIRFERPPASVADDDNPAVALQKAAALLQLSRDEEVVLWGDESVPWSEYKRTPGDQQKAIEIVRSREEVFRWVDEAGRRKGAIVQKDASLVPPLGWSRTLSRLLLAAMQMDHERGDDAAALHELQRIYTVARAVDHGGTLISNLVAIAIRAMLASGVEYLEPSLRLRLEDGSVAQARQLLNLLDDPAPVDAVAWNFEQEIGKAAAFADQSGFNAWWIRPLRDDEVARSQRTNAKTVAGTRASNLAEANKLFPAGLPTPLETNLNRIVYWEESYSSAFTPRIMLLHFRGRCDNAAAAVLLACRIYQAEQGAFPKTLGELSPGYLPAAPDDPFLPAHGPLHYRVDPDGPTVWSVGENSHDDGAVVLFGPDGTKLRRHGNQLDKVYGAGWRTATPPASAAAPAAAPAGTATAPAGQ